jgi:hypothetical protein
MKIKIFIIVMLIFLLFILSLPADEIHNDLK